MAQTLNREEFIEMLAADHGLSKTEAKALYDKFMATHERAILTGKRVLVGNLYRVEATVRKGGMRHNPKTGEKVEVANRARLKLIIGTAFQNQLTEAFAK